jgi:hypothetical protein
VRGPVVAELPKVPKELGGSKRAAAVPLTRRLFSSPRLGALVRLQRNWSVDWALPGWREEALHSRLRATLQIVRTEEERSFRQPADCEKRAHYLSPFWAQHVRWGKRNGANRFRFRFRFVFHFWQRDAPFITAQSSLMVEFDDRFDIRPFDHRLDHSTIDSTKVSAQSLPMRQSTSQKRNENENENVSLLARFPKRTC